MKKILFLLVLIITSLVSQTYAAEGVLVDHVSAPNIESNASSNIFRIIVTGNGKFIAKPGVVFTEGDDLQGGELPYLLDSPKPISYPRWAVSNGWQGKLILAVEIKTDGSVGLSKVMHSSGYKLLDQTAVQAVQDWKFHPAIKDGKPLRTCIQIPISFQLEEEQN